MKTTTHLRSNVPLRLLGIYGGAFAALFLFFALAAHFLRVSNTSSGVPIPDGKVVAEQLLEQKLSGPRYFHLGEPSAELPSPYLTPAQAREQMDRVIAERHWDAAARGKIENLIKTLTEPSPSRMVGTERINALRLNLALDEL